MSLADDDGGFGLWGRFGDPIVPVKPRSVFRRPGFGPHARDRRELDGQAIPNRR